MEPTTGASFLKMKNVTTVRASSLDWKFQHPTNRNKFTKGIIGDNQETMQTLILDLSISAILVKKKRNASSPKFHPLTPKEAVEKKNTPWPWCERRSTEAVRTACWTLKKVRSQARSNRCSVSIRRKRFIWLRVATPATSTLVRRYSSI